MAYEVTATRRRPQRFEDLVGQEFVAETFRNTIASGKIAHAYLFSGPRGCGKTSTARILAKALNCQKGPTASPCGECEACKEITAGSSLDVIEIDGASNTSVNDVRQIKDEVLFPPNSCRYKIYIIDEVHMLSTSAFNALLKTIEEPPPYVVFIFATTELQKVPATIKSRCQQFNFRLVPVEKVKEQLALAAQESGIKADDEALYWIARESGGSMRDSYTLFDQVAAFSGGEITYEKIRDKLGLVGVDRLNELFGLCVKGDSTNALLKLDEYMQNGVSIEQLISNCTDYLRSVLLIKNGVKKEALLGQSAERFSAEVLDAWNSVQIERALGLFMQLYRDIRYSLSPRYEFELAVSRLCWLSEYVSPADVKKAVDAVKPLLDESVRASASVAASAVASGAGVSSSQAGISSQAGTSSQAGAKSGGAYVPQFAALQEDSGGQSHPFPDGGAEPPDTNSAENIGADAASSWEDSEQPPAPDEGEWQGGFDWQPSPEGQVSTLSEVVPEQAAPLGQAEQIEQAESDLPQTEVPVSSVDTGDIQKVRATMISDFSVNEPLIAGLLEKTFDWKLEGDTLVLCTENTFEIMQLEQNAAKFAGYLEKVYGRRIDFKPVHIERKPEVTLADLPVQVQLLRDTFKGSVIGIN
ncbi:MAG TPA: DNA polymerase III subunit gamma/tau [Treponema sp.]|nr:DNA polymerase III subunit gamma/tau [Treponema sp.]